MFVKRWQTVHSGAISRAKHQQAINLWDIGLSLFSVMFCLLTDLFIAVHAASSFTYSKKKIFVLFQNTKYYRTAAAIKPKLLLLSWLIIFRYSKVRVYAVCRQLHCTFVTLPLKAWGSCWQQLTPHWRVSCEAPVVLLRMHQELPGKHRLCWSLGLHHSWASSAACPSLGTPGSGDKLPLAARTAALPISVDSNHGLWTWPMDCFSG